MSESPSTGERPSTTERVGRVAAYLLLGVVGTVSVALGTLFGLQALQPAIYGAAYRALGPSGATEFAILTHFVLSGALAIAATALTAEYVSERGDNARAFSRALGAMGLLVAAYAAAALAGVDAFGAALAWVVAIAGAVPLLLWFHYGVRSGGLAAFVGGMPVLLLLLLFAGVGVGWGWGFAMTAEEVPGSAVDDADVASFDAVPEVREDLLAARNCEVTADGQRRCLVELRGYIHERAAARFMDRHGVRCPYEGSGEDPGSFVAEHEGTYYRVSCAAHGD